MQTDPLLEIFVAADCWFTVPTDQTLNKLISPILAEMTYSNPKYEDAQRLGFSTFGIPKEIRTYSLEKDNTKENAQKNTQESAIICRFSRGELHRFIRAVPAKNLRITERFYDVQTLPTIAYENKEFLLDERQERCLQAIRSKKQGVIHAATSAGKSAILMRAIAERGVRTLVIVHRKILLDQLVADARKWLKGVRVETLSGGGLDKPGGLGEVVFAIDRTVEKGLRTLPDQFSGFGLVIQDEAHLAATNTFQGIIGRIPAPYRYGLTGTVKRKDRMQFLIFATFGPIIATVSKDELEEAGRTTPVEFVVHETDVTAPDEVFDLPSTAQWQALDKIVHSTDSRFRQTVDLVRQIHLRDASGEIRGDIGRLAPARIAIVCRFVEPCKRLARELESAGYKVGLVTGQEKDNSQTCQDLEEGKIQIIVATIGVISTGVNIKSLTDLILFSPIFSNELLLHQLRGRLYRVSPGKTRAYMHLLYDPNLWPGRMGRVLSILKR